jgi:hypothetical protein
MEIIGRNPQPDPYSISNVRVRFTTAEQFRSREDFNKGNRGRTVVSKLRVIVDLEPEPYLRERGFGTSFERKDNACTLQIEQDELEQIQETLRQELQNAYQFLMDQKLFGAFEQHKKEELEEQFGGHRRTPTHATKKRAEAPRSVAPKPTTNRTFCPLSVSGGFSPSSPSLSSRFGRFVLFRTAHLDPCRYFLGGDR